MRIDDRGATPELSMQVFDRELQSLRNYLSTCDGVRKQVAYKGIKHIVFDPDAFFSRISPATIVDPPTATEVNGAQGHGSATVRASCPGCGRELEISIS